MAQAVNWRSSLQHTVGAQVTCWLEGDVPYSSWGRAAPSPPCLLRPGARHHLSGNRKQSHLPRWWLMAQPLASVASDLAGRHGSSPRSACHFGGALLTLLGNSAPWLPSEPDLFSAARHSSVSGFLHWLKVWGRSLHWIRRDLEVGTQRSGILALGRTGCMTSGKVCPSLGLNIPICTLA